MRKEFWIFAGFEGLWINLYLLFFFFFLAWTVYFFIEDSKYQELLDFAVWYWNEVLRFPLRVPYLFKNKKKKSQFPFSKAERFKFEGANCVELVFFVDWESTQYGY